MGQKPPWGSKSNKKRLTSLDLKAKEVSLGDGWQVSGRSTDPLECSPSKWSESRSALLTDTHSSPPPSPTSGGNDELKPNSANLRVYHNLWRDWPLIRTSHVSDAKLTLGLWVGFISSHLTADKLFPINLRAIMGPPKMSLLLEGISLPVLIIRPRLILVALTDDIRWNKTSYQ